ncbi:MAG: hypothetical protein ACXWBN_01975 [Acidimicrobiales bacterium]
MHEHLVITHLVADHHEQLRGRVGRSHHPPDWPRDRPRRPIEALVVLGRRFSRR